MTWAAVAIGGGMALSAGAGALGSQSSNRAARQSRDWTNSRTSEGMDRLYGLLFGQQGLNARNGLRPAGPIDTSGAAVAPSGGIAGYNDRTLARGQRMYNRGYNLFNRDASNIFGLASGAEDMAMQSGRGLDRLGAEAEGFARQYGRGANAQIDAETANALQSANALSQARLNASGLGNSTLVGNALSGNALNAGLQAGRQKVDIQREMTDRLLGARQNRIQTGQLAAGRMLGARQNTIGTQQSLAAARAGLNTGAASLFMDQRNRNASTLLSGMMSGVANPWLGQPTSQYYPGMSSAGSALAIVGTSLGALGANAGRSNGGGGSPTATNYSPEQMLALMQPGVISGL